MGGIIGTKICVFRPKSNPGILLWLVLLYLFILFLLLILIGGLDPGFFRLLSEIFFFEFFSKGFDGIFLFRLLPSKRKGRFY